MANPIYTCHHRDHVWMKAGMGMRKTAMGFVIAVAVLGGCDGVSTEQGRDGVVKSSALSANGAVEASVVTEGFGATVPEVVSVRIRHGKEEAEALLTADHVRNLTVHWKDDRHLEINMECGRIFRFTNFFDVLDKAGKLEYGINVRLLNTSLCDSEGSAGS